ncbi:MAG: FRG domain-containing protein [Chitinophagaceae bacterium]|nr:FRG domain-containing protein [Chitinophagaceae bacterium]
MKKIQDYTEIFEFSSVAGLWKKLETLSGQNQWIFRGQREYSWGLKTSLDRMFEEYKNNNGSKLNAEIALIKRFQRESHHYGISNIDYLNIPEWLCLMQHFGAPTRLLDWTHSPWVGLFFAIIDLKEKESAALWVANWKKIESKTDSKLLTLYKRDHNLISIDDFSESLSYGDEVIKLNSFRQNQRQIIQQGTFLFPTNIEKTFEENLTVKISKKELLKIKLPYSFKSELIKRLYRMNISFTTLNPGIEGFSRSLNSLHNLDGIFKLEDNIKDYRGYKEKFIKKNGS